MDFLKELISGSVFMPHGMCFRWTLPLLQLHVASDALIALAYASLPITLFWLVRKKRDIPFNWMFVLFLIFILLCGVYHMLEIVTLWLPIYWISGINKAFLAIGSITTAILLTRLIPRALALPSPQALTEANTNLSQTNENLRLLSDHLAQVRDQAIKASKLKSQFLANTSHEFRTPIAGVLGMSELLLETDLNTEQREILQAVEVSGQALLTTINNVLVFSRIEAGKLKIESIPFSIHWMLKSTINQITPGAFKKGITISTNVDSRISHVLKGDPERLGQILNNMLDNCVQFANSKEIALTATLLGDDGEKEELLFEVQSRGMQLVDGDQVHMLELAPDANSKETDTSSELISCANLGLSICKKLAELMDGEIGARTDTASGASIIWCRVKLAKITDPEEMKQARYSLLSELMISCPETFVAGREDHRDAHTKTSENLPAVTSLNMSATNSDFRPPASGTVNPAATSNTLPAMSADTLQAMAAAAHKAMTAGAHPVAGSVPSGLAPNNLAAGATNIAPPVPPGEKASSTSDALPVTHTIATSKPQPTGEDPASELSTMHIVHDPVLVVDDSRVQRDIIISQLQKFGITAHSAGNGRDAIEKATQCHYSLILMDSQMPELDGCSATEQIRRQQESTGNHSTIVGMTASSEPDDHYKCLKAGMDDTLTKPVSADQLRKLVQGGD